MTDSGTKNPPLCKRDNFFVSFIGQEEHIQLIPRKAGWNSLGVLALFFSGRY